MLIDTDLYIFFSYYKNNIIKKKIEILLMYKTVYK